MLKTLGRSLLASGAATIVDLASLFVMVTVLGIAPRVASIPALLLAAIVQFTAQRRFAFQSSDNAIDQAIRFASVHAMTLFLNALLFDLAVRFDVVPYWLLRLVVGNAVYLAWSFPMLRRTFSARRA